MGKLVVVVGGQYGSEAKGHVVGYLAARESRPLVIRVGGSQAGHTVVDPADGTRWALRHVPVAAVTNKGARLAIAAGSEIDLDVLGSEIEQLDAAGYGVSDRLVVDVQATIIDQAHKTKEAALLLGERVGSTCKGVGAARAARALRTATLVHELCGEIESRWPGVVTGNVERRGSACMEDGGTVIIEAAQGYGLGLHAGHYPKCTSSDCRVIDALAMAGISPWSEFVDVFEPWVVFRTYPIRVAGDSGAMWHEMSWEDLATLHGDHIQPEHTTVTRKVRRVGAWDSELATKAVRANGGAAVRAALMFADYPVPSLAGQTDRVLLDGVDGDWAAVELLARVEGDLGVRVQLVGTGPGTLIDRR